MMKLRFREKLEDATQFKDHPVMCIFIQKIMMVSHRNWAPQPARAAEIAVLIISPAFSNCHLNYLTYLRVRQQLPP